MLTENQAEKVREEVYKFIYRAFGKINCETCRNEEDLFPQGYCEDCSYSEWSISKEFAEDIADAVMDIIEENTYE